MKKVIDIYGHETLIDETSQKLYTYNNRKKEIQYNAEVMDDNGNRTGFFTNYIEKGIIIDVNDKLNVWNSTLKFYYASMVGFKASENDPDRKIYDKFVEYVKNNEEKFFTKTGDYRKKYLVNIDDIKKAMNE